MSGLESMHTLMRYVNIDGHTHIVHISGTNGKGSTSIKLAEILKRAKYKVGMYTSPHVLSVRERIQVSGEIISQSDFSRCVSRVLDVNEAQRINASYFEVITAASFLHFCEQKVDVAVVECGLGGRLDATNVIQKPILSIITTVGLDHMEILGDSVEKIAREKAGIIKPRCPVLVGSKALPFSVIEEIARERDSPVFVCEKNVPGIDYESYNRNVAECAAELLSDGKVGTAFHIDKESIESGLEANLPGRFQQIRFHDSQVILDVGHNPQGLMNLGARLQSFVKDRQIQIIFGFSSEKDIKGCCRALLRFPNLNRLHAVSANHPRSSRPDDLARIVNTLSSKDICATAQSLTHCLDSLKNNKNEVIVICGSVFLMKEAFTALGIHQTQDDEEEHAPETKIINPKA